MQKFPGKVFLNREKEPMKKGYILLTFVLAICVAGCSRMVDETENQVNPLTASDAAYVNVVAGHLLAAQELVLTANDRLTDNAVMAYNQEVGPVFSKAHTDLLKIASYFNFTITADIDSFFTAHAAILESTTAATFDSVYLDLQVERHDALLAALADQRRKADPDLLRNHADKYWPILYDSRDKAMKMQ